MQFKKGRQFAKQIWLRDPYKFVIHSFDFLSRALPPSFSCENATSLADGGKISLRYEPSSCHPRAERSGVEDLRGEVR